MPESAIESLRNPSPATGEDSVRLRILQVGARLIAEYGIAGMSMRHLAAECGFSTGTINYHFTNKRKLSIAVLEFVYRLPADWDAQRARRAGIPRLLAPFVLENELRRNWWKFWLRYGAEASIDPELRAYQVRRMASQERFYARTIREATERGEMHPIYDAEECARALLGLAHGLAVAQVVDGSPESVTRAKAVLELQYETIIRPVVVVE